MKSLSQIIYASMQTVPVRSVLLDIARAAERRNTQLNVSGILIYSDLRYLQLLEGPPKAVAEIFDAISFDFRHEIRQVVTLAPSRRLISPSLPMGFVNKEVPQQYLFRLKDRAELVLGEFRRHASDFYPSALASA